MKKIDLLSPLLITLVLFLGRGASADTNVLNVQHYLTQVQTGSAAFKASTRLAQGAEARQLEGSLVYYPTVTALAQTGEDKKQSFFLPYTSMNSKNYSLGIKQAFRFGANAQLSYGINDFEYVGMKPRYYDASPKLEASFALLRNRGGSETGALEELTNQQATAQLLNSRFETRMTKAQAEATYYRLALSRDLRDIAKNAVGRAQKLLDWSLRRSKLQLQDQSDLFQAQANFESKQISLAQAEEQERTASREFNKARGIQSEITPETLQAPSPESLIVPKSKSEREDLQAARAQSELAQAQTLLATEKIKSNLELFGSYALNSKQESSLGDALSGGFKTDRPTSLVGIKFTTSLSWGAHSRVNEGYLIEREAAEARLVSKSLDHETEWQELNQKWADSQKRLELAIRLEAVQKQKVIHERDRLAKGRTTTYQQLLFEQDFSFAQIQRVQTQLEVLETFVKLKTFSNDTGAAL